MAQQAADVQTVVRIQRNPDLAVITTSCLPTDERGGDRAQMLGVRGGDAGVGQLVEQDVNSSPPSTAHAASARTQPFDALGHGGQQLIAGFVARVSLMNLKRSR